MIQPATGFSVAAVVTGALLASCAAPPQPSLPQPSPQPVARFEPAPVIHFAQNWCPETANLDRLRGHASLLRSGCCIVTATPIDPLGVPAGILAPFAGHIVQTPGFGRCTGSSTESRAEAALEAEALSRAQAELTAGRAESARREKQLAASAAADQRKAAPGLFRVASDWMLCVDGGGLARGRPTTIAPLIGIDATPFLQAELKQRRIEFDVSRAANREVRIGDTYCHVLAALGRPSAENRTVTALGTSLQLVYGQHRYVYLKNGKVDAWQD